MLSFNPRDLRKMLKRMGIEMEEVRAEKVDIYLDDGSVLRVSSPQVLVMRARGQPPVIYVSGDITRVEAEAGDEGFTEEDVRLVAEQAGVSLEEARRALKEAGGDIAEAILRLQEGR